MATAEETELGHGIRCHHLDCVICAQRQVRYAQRVQGDETPNWEFGWPYNMCECAFCNRNSDMKLCPACSNYEHNNHIAYNEPRECVRCNGTRTEPNVEKRLKNPGAIESNPQNLPEESVEFTLKLMTKAIVRLTGQLGLLDERIDKLQVRIIQIEEKMGSAKISFSETSTSSAYPRGKYRRHDDD